MIVASGNWWQPEYYGDPCAVGTPTFTATPTKTPADCPVSFNNAESLTVNGTSFSPTTTTP